MRSEVGALQIIVFATAGGLFFTDRRPVNLSFRENADMPLG
jgi:hypothetical protein